MKNDHLDCLRATRSIAFQSIFVDWTGSINSALMLSQLAYWTSKVGWNRWIYKTSKDWEEELRLSKKEQQNARRKLRESGLIKEKLMGVPAKTHFQIDQETYLKKFRQLYSPKVQSSCDKRDQLEGTKGIN